MALTPVRPASLPAASHGAPAALVADGLRFITINGQVSRDVDGRLVDGRDPVTQSRQTWRNVRLALAGAGATGRDVAQYRISVVGYRPEYAARVLAVGREVFEDDWMEDATGIIVGVVALGRPDLLIEIEAIAVL